MSNIRFKVQAYLTMEEMEAIDKVLFLNNDTLMSAMTKIKESRTYVNEMQRMFLDEVTGEEKEMLTASFTFKEE